MAKAPSAERARQAAMSALPTDTRIPRCVWKARPLADESRNGISHLKLLIDRRAGPYSEGWMELLNEQEQQMALIQPHLGRFEIRVRLDGYAARRSRFSRARWSGPRCTSSGRRWGGEFTLGETSTPTGCGWNPIFPRDGLRYPDPPPRWASHESGSLCHQVSKGRQGAEAVLGGALRTIGRS